MTNDIITTTKSALLVLDGEECTKDQVLEALGFVTRLKEIVRELDEQAKSGAIAWINKHGDITSGTVRYYVGVNKTVKCKDVKGTLKALLDKAGGDLDSVAECFSSGAWKPAATKKVLGDDADAYFETTTTSKLEEGKPVATLQVFDSKFFPAGMKNAGGKSMKGL